MATHYPSLLAERVQTLRRALGISQQELAHRANLSISVVSMIEQAVRPDPRLSTVIKLSFGLGVTLSQLLEKEGRQKRK